MFINTFDFYTNTFKLQILHFVYYFLHVFKALGTSYLRDELMQTI